MANIVPDGLKIHFQAEKMQFLEGNEKKEDFVCEPIRKGQILVSVSPELIEKGMTLVAGENCELSVNEDSILSRVSGYPHWQLDDNNQCLVHVEPLVRVSSDKMTAQVLLYPCINNRQPKPADIIAMLAAEGVSFGLDEGAVAEVLLRTGEEEKRVISFVAARGKPAVHGNDAHTRIEVETGSTIGEMQEDGSLNFKERRMFTYVDEGQLIATVIPATSGTAGRNVLGVTIEPKPGRDITIRVTEDAVYDEEKAVVKAGKGGVVSVVNETTFKVTSKQTISSDIDYSTGNIYAKNNVDVTGSVKPDFVLSVRGDVRIGEHVQSATVNTQGNLVVSGGIMGDKAQLNVRGDADLKFIEKGTIFVGGHVVLRNNAYYCRMEAGGDILGGGSSKIVGGRVVCGGQLCIANIGSESADPALIAVGVDAKRLAVFEQLQERVTEIEEKLTSFHQRFGIDAEKPQKINDLIDELASIRQRLSRFNLIKGSPEDSLGREEFSECLADLIVTGTIVAGTMLRIGNLTKIIEKNFSKKKFRVDSNFKAIVADNL